MGSGTEFSGIWDLEVTFPNGDVRTVAKGTVTCVDDITHSGVAPPTDHQRRADDVASTMSSATSRWR